MEAIAGLGVMAEAEDFATKGAGTVSTHLALTAGLSEWTAAAPEVELLDALEAGRVTASACSIQLIALPQPGSSFPSKQEHRREVGRDEWQKYELRDLQPPYDKATSAVPKGTLYGVTIWAGLTDILFDRERLTEAFPGRGSNEVVPDADTGPARWNSRDAREAQRRLAELFAASPTEALMKNAQLKIWLSKEMGRPVSRMAFDTAKAQAIASTGADAWSRPGAPKGGRE